MRGSGSSANNEAEMTLFPLPTTLKTSTTATESETDDSGTSAYPVPTGEESLVDKIPNDPNLPWGGHGPAHTHYNNTHHNEGITLHARNALASRWDAVINNVKAIWHRLGPETAEGA